MNPIIDLGHLTHKVAYIVGDTPKMNVLNNVVDNYMRKILRDVCDADKYIAFLDGTGNFRYKVHSEYKANRKTKEKPKSLRHVYNRFITRWKANVVNGIEADDAVIITYLTLKDESACILGQDKDLLQVPGLHMSWSNSKKEYEKIRLKPHMATLNLASQMIKGDSADNIKGIEGSGDAVVKRLLYKEENIPIDHSDLYSTVLEAYSRRYGIDDGFYKFCQNGMLLAMKREEDRDFKVPQWINIKK